MARPSVPVFILLLSLVLALPSSAAEPDKFISVEGSGTVSAPPDMAVVTAGVVTQAAGAHEAVDRNNAAMPALLKLLNEMGIGEADIRTRGFNVTPRYSRRTPGGNAPRIEGYQASNRVEVKVRKLSILGELLDRLVTAGANTVHGVDLRIASPEPLLDQARRKAVADAIRRAALYAAAAGVQLGKVLRIEERTMGLPRPRAMEIGAVRASASVSIAQGRQEIRATVGVTFAIE